VADAGQHRCKLAALQLSTDLPSYIVLYSHLLTTDYHVFIMTTVLKLLDLCTAVCMHAHCMARTEG
jgi:hypothetical protein